jgi:hypothetical protein
MPVGHHLLAVSALLLACGAGGLAQECSDAQRNKLKEFFRGRLVTAKIDLPLVQSPGGLWVFWNGQYDIETYAESFKHGPASILRGQSSSIKDVRVRGKEILYDVGGRGLLAHWKGPYDKTPEEVYKHGSLVSVTFGRKLSAADCSIESNIRALSGVLEIAGVDAPPPFSGISAAPEEATPKSAKAVDSAPKGASGCELISAEAQPNRLHVGETIRLIAHLSVSGDSPVEVTELRQIYFEGQGLFSQPREATSSWEAGVHQSTLTFAVPDVAKPGIYRYEVLVRGPGAEQRKGTLFEIY